MKYGIYNKAKRQVGVIFCDNLYEEKVGDVSMFYIRDGEDGEISGTIHLSPDCSIEEIS